VTGGPPRQKPIKADKSRDFSQDWLSSAFGPFRIGFYRLFVRADLMAAPQP
jgi:hypothetical protein